MLCMNNFWDTGVWGGINVFAMLLVGLMAASLIKKTNRKLKDSLIPTAVLAGGVLLFISGIHFLISGKSLFETSFMGGNGFAILETVTYHSLALGFIASTFESSGEKALNKERLKFLIPVSQLSALI